MQEKKCPKFFSSFRKDSGHRMSYQNNTFRQDPIYYQNGMAKFGVANMSDLISDLQRELMKNIDIKMI